MKGIIIFEDGTVFKGKGFGYSGTRVGELVFNTAMTGYQKTLTDPSYSEQLITMTYPILGNYGINETDYESDRIHAMGVIANDVCFEPSNWKSVSSIDAWLKEQGVPGVYNVDTREITRKLRNEGNQKCLISNEKISLAEMKTILAKETLRGDQMKYAGTKEIVKWEKEDNKYNVAVLDFGVKRSILNELFNRGCNLTIYPYATKARIILAEKPDGIFLTNGPGDPAEATEAVKIIEKLITNSNYGPNQMPIFGICMGHQLIALAQGGSTYKLKYGHRGCNHGVFDKNNGRSSITSQNHGYAVKAESIVLKGMEVSHLNLNDGTVEGMQHLSKPVFSVQFHPESNPGPNDTGYLFDKFIDLMEGGRL
ncbi:MAG: glutamine-hydrolyzing carbamoyl-phosphate synthase small subunit [Eubacteriaceae bacterium]|nr:glutamine-hydrolyzing carbamoyl-phosphate synthase small subunit [Eubacteriaceae bacterium]